MLIKKITSKNFLTGENEEREYRFHLSKPEITDLEFDTEEKLSDKIKIVMAKKDDSAIYRIFKELIFKSYGEVSADGSRFIKEDADGKPLAKKFMQTDAYSQLFEELCSDENAIVAFFKGLLPEGYTESKEYKEAEEQTKVMIANYLAADN